ncbi:MAG: metal-dependent hydrolase [Acidobacteria bacterium]|nr:metal-dependent hydrolase [Acidobacteriota bacterium]
MAFPAAHCTLGCGIATLLGQKVNSFKWMLFWSLLSIAPDFDFALVFLFDLSKREYHRTFTHSIAFMLLASAVIFLIARKMDLLRGTRSWLAVCLVLGSHMTLDSVCVSNMARDGVMVFWPFSRHTVGYPSGLVSLYQWAGGDPAGLWRAALPYTLVEIVLWSPLMLWVFSRQCRPQSAPKSVPAERLSGYAWFTGQRSLATETEEPGP